MGREMDLVFNYSESYLFECVLSKGNEILDNHYPPDTLIQCRLSPTPLRLSQNDLMNVFVDQDTTLIEMVTLCRDGDIFIWLKRDDTNYLQLIRCLFLETYGEQIHPNIPPEECFIRYDFGDDYSVMRSAVFKKQGIKSKKAIELEKYFTTPSLINTLQKTIHLIAMQRAFRTKPHIMIVEDQPFSQDLLAAALDGHTCHTVSNVADAFVTYIEKCPDIVFLGSGSIEYVFL